MMMMITTMNAFTVALLLLIQPWIRIPIFTTAFTTNKSTKTQPRIFLCSTRTPPCSVLLSGYRYNGNNNNNINNNHGGGGVVVFGASKTMTTMMMTPSVVNTTPYLSHRSNTNHRQYHCLSHYSSPGGGGGHGSASGSTKTSLRASTTDAADDGDNNNNNNWEVVVFMSLLALQFGVQPSLVRNFVPPTICRSSFVLVQEALKFVMASVGLFGSGRTVRSTALQGWKPSTALRIAGIPAFLYLIQNMASLLAYQNLLPLTYNVLNQTKTLSAALCCYLIIGRKQTKPQIVSLFLLLLSALVMEKVVSLRTILGVWQPLKAAVFGVTTTATTTSATAMMMTTTARPRHYVTHGILPILLASFLSGLAGALTQKNLQDEKGCGRSGGRNAYLFSMELNFFSFFILCASLLVSQDGSLIFQNGLFHNWTGTTIIPIVTNAFGGIVVGLVTKYAGSVKKGFALIFGILISGMLQAFQSGGGVEGIQIVGGVMAAFSLWLHTSYPHRTPT